MTSSLTELRPPPTLPSTPPTPPIPTKRTPSRAGYWVAAIVAVLGLTAAFVWGAVGTITALDRVDSFDRTAVPGAITVSVTDPATMVVYYEGPAEVARYADPTATGRNPTRWNPGTDASTVVSYAANTPTWQQLRLTVTGPDGAVVPISTLPVDRSLRRRPWPARPGGGEVRRRHRRAVPGVGRQGHRARRDAGGW